MDELTQAPKSHRGTDPDASAGPLADEEWRNCNEMGSLGSFGVIEHRRTTVAFRALANGCFFSLGVFPVLMASQRVLALNCGH